ncbi:hypothetical protein O181_128470 [Austropuccinia psidii MF-1]|uniref:Uncharacterized protein n=1 Tax=Austropuccinia psidii MF-1 TaxID=1389203 RepID=A0A9Q3Q917_9BASI|nr:hypothetical protein [Austropuccinia psidii MF-1]
MGRNHSLQYVVQLGPFCPNPMRPKGGGQVGPKPQLGPPEPILAIRPSGPNFGQEPPWTTFQPMAFGNHQGPPDQLRSSFPITLRGIPSLLHAPRTQGYRSGASMDPIPSFQIKVPNSNAHFEGGLLNSSVWKFMAAIRRPFKDPNHLALQELGWQFIQDYSKGRSQSLYIISISCQGIKYFNTPWTTQLVHTGRNQSTCMYLAQLGQFVFHCWN